MRALLSTWTLCRLVAADLTTSSTAQEGLVLKATGPKTRNIDEAYAHVSAKYNIVPSSLGHDLNERSVKLASTSFGGDFGYTVSLNFGSQGNKAFPMLVDTGSALTWAFGTMVKTAEIKTLNHYSPTSSQESTNRVGKMSYGGGGYIQGKVYKDSLKLGGVTCPIEITVVQKESGNGGLHASGLLALSINPSSKAQDDSGITRIHSSLIKAGISNGVFSVDFKPDPSGQSSGGGELVFAPNVNKYGSITWVSVTGAGYDWLLPTSQIKIGNQVIHRPVSTGKKSSSGKRHATATSAHMHRRTNKEACAWLDTGTTLNLIDDATLNAVVAKLPGAKRESGNSYSVPCKKPQNAPDAIWWEFGGKWFPLYYKIGSLLWYDRGDGHCAITLKSRGSGDGCDVMGAFFFHGVYAVFDDKNKRVGLAVKH